MIDLLKVIDFQDCVECQDTRRRSRESFLPINYEFKRGNAYGVFSDFGCGSWGLSTSLGGRGSFDYSGKIILNDEEIKPNQLSKYACFVAENRFPDIDSFDGELTPKVAIEKAIALSRVPFSVEQIKDTFCLSDGRFERPITEVSGEIWLISLAVNFALGKEIFCYPWLNQIDIERFKIACEHNIIDFLKREQKIIIVPSSQKKFLRKYCDHRIVLDRGRIRYR